MIKQELIEAGARMVAAGLVQGSGGNISARQGSDFIITRTQSKLDILTANDFVTLSLIEPHHPGSSIKPSAEWIMHHAIYTAHHHVQVILHAHPPYAIALGVAGRTLPALTPDSYLHLGGEVPLLPYSTPATADFAKEVAQALRHECALLLQNHGVVVTGGSVSQALLRLLTLEEHAHIYQLAHSMGGVRPLTPDEHHALDTQTNGRYQIKG